MAHTNKIYNDKNSFTIFFLVLFFVFLYARPHTFIGALEPLKLTALTVVFAVFFSYAEQFRKSFIWKAPLFWYFFCLILLAAVLAPFSISSELAADFLADTFVKTFIAFWIILIAVTNYSRLKTVITTIFLSTSVIALRILLELRAGNYEISQGVRRVLILGDPNYLALILVMFVPAGLYLSAVSRKLAGKCLYIALVSLSFAALLFTGSRGGYLGFFAGVISYLLLLNRGKVIKISFATLLFLGAVLTFTPEEYKERFISSFDSEDYSYRDRSLGRVSVWKAGIGFIITRPGGVGIKNFPLAHADFLRRRGLPGRGMTAHNAFIEVGAELGILGLILYILLLKCGLQNSKKSLLIAEKLGIRDAAACACALQASLIAFLAASFFLSQAYYENHYIIIALTYALKRSLEREYRRTRMEENNVF